jgi:hypothetical protein
MRVPRVERGRGKDRAIEQRQPGEHEECGRRLQLTTRYLR